MSVSFKSISVIILSMFLAGCNHVQPSKVGNGCNTVEQITCQNARIQAVREMCEARASYCGW